MDESGNSPAENLLQGNGLGQAVNKQKRTSYKKMIAEAIEVLKERRGSSRQSIVKFITSKYGLGRGGSTRINSMITKMCKNKQLLRTRGTMEDGAFKLSISHTTPFASAGRSRRGKSKRRGRKTRGKKRKGRGSKRRKRKGRKGKKRKVKKGRRGRKRKGKGKKKKSSRNASFFPGF